MNSLPSRVQLSAGRSAPGRATRRDFLGLSLLAVAAPIAAAHARWRQPGGAPGQQEGEQEGGDSAFQWIEVREGVWAAVGGGGNSMLAISGGEAVLVDTKLANLGATLQRESAARAKLAMVINTHHHADHSGGNFAFTESRLIAHDKAAQRIGGQTDEYIRQLRSLSLEAAGEGAVRKDLEQVWARIDELGESDWKPRETMEGDGAEWTIGDDLKIEAHHFGAGHTDNDIAILLPEQNVMHAGDLLFHQMHPFFDPDGGVTCKGWIESVKGAIELCDAETVVIPGHGLVTDREGLKAQLRYLEKLWEEVGELVDDGWTRERATQMQWPFMDGLGRPELRVRAIETVFDERSGG